MAFNQSAAIIVVAAALLAAVAMGQSPSPSPSPSGAAGAPGPASLDCTSYVLNLSDCLSYVLADSNLTAPEKGCCPEVAGLVESHPICLCWLLANANSSGIQISISRALKLPSACGVSTPPLSSCSAAGYPIGVPLPSEAPSPPDKITGGAAAGGPESGKSGVSSNPILSLWSLLVGFVMIIYLTTFF